MRSDEIICILVQFSGVYIPVLHNCLRLAMLRLLGMYEMLCLCYELLYVRVKF